MKLERLRWILLSVAAVTVLVMLLKGVTSGRLGLSVICTLVWYALSCRKTQSLDRDRFAGGKLGGKL